MFEVYGTQQCPWCDRVKELIETNGHQYNYTDVGESEEAQKMFQENQWRTVPQVIYNGQHIGGYEAVAKFLKEKN